MFKKGDKIQCVKNESYVKRLTVGHIYTVDRCTGDWVYIIDDQNLMGGWYPNWFRLVKKPNKTPDEIKEYLRKKISDLQTCEKSEIGSAYYILAYQDMLGDCFNVRAEIVKKTVYDVVLKDL